MKKKLIKNKTENKKIVAVNMISEDVDTQLKDIDFDIPLKVYEPSIDTNYVMGIDPITKTNSVIINDTFDTLSNDEFFIALEQNEKGIKEHIEKKQLPKVNINLNELGSWAAFKNENTYEPIPVENNDFDNDDENENENEDEDENGNVIPPIMKEFPRKPDLLNQVLNLTSIENITIGSDFEVFLFDNNKKEVVNAAPYVRGTKYEPFNFDSSSPFWSTSLDNVLAEGNIPPCKTAQEFNSNIEYVLDYIKSTLPSNLSIINEPAIRMKEEYLNTPEAKEFGCTPSLNAYTEFENRPPKGSKTNLRTGAFHIHLKYDNMNFNTSVALIKCMDLFLGIPSLLIEPPNDRRQLYGTAGEFRFHPEKTTEYRVLSTYFCKDQYLRKWAFQNTLKAIDFYNSVRGKRFLSTIEPTIIRETIENSNILNAELLVKKFNIPLYLDVA